ncbi:MAG: aminotransferase class I/II-fold pyridoxal phosphate-dependent enzyme [Pseudonocardiaceae bacterium]
MTNTEYERLALTGGINLSDGHARLPLDTRQREIIHSLPDLFHEIDRANQESLETSFLRAFFDLCGQPSALRSAGLHLSFSASSGLKIIAQTCRRQGLRVLLIEPVFDNIRHFLEFEEVTVSAVSECSLRALERLVWPSGKAALWLVLPNNPTGFCLSEAEFRAVVAQCRGRNCALIVDASFRPHSEAMLGWDMYDVLQTGGVEHMVVEDTGKTWSLHDIKVGVTAASAGFAEDLHVLHDQLLLHVSPLHLAVLTRFVVDSRERGLDATIRSTVRRNRGVIHELVRSDGYEHHGDCANVPLELLGVPAGMTAHSFWAACRDVGVEVLPAQNYYWSSARGHRLFRVPLARPTEDLINARDLLHRVRMTGETRSRA